MIDYANAIFSIVSIVTIISMVYFAVGLNYDQIKTISVITLSLSLVFFCSVSHNDIKIYQYGKENVLKEELTFQRERLNPIQQKIDILEKQLNGEIK